MTLQAMTASATCHVAAQPVVTFSLARELTARYGAPLLVVSHSGVVENYSRLRDLLPDVELFYAAKANSHPCILNTLHELGSSIDISSYQEVCMALEAGFTPEQMIHTQPCKSPADLSQSYEAGVRCFTFDSAYELDKFQGFDNARLILRIATPSSSSVINLSSKFGAAIGDCPRLIKAAQKRGLEVCGLSFHVGSQCLDPHAFENAFRSARYVWDEANARGAEMSLLDIGGGFPAPNRQSVPDIADFTRTVWNAYLDHFDDVRPRVIAEPGRYLCAEAITLITSVIGKSVRNNVQWYYIDDGLYGSFSAKVYDHADFTMLAESDDPAHPCVIAGPTCDSTDVVATDQPMPELQIGDLLLVPAMGAYTLASATQFNGLPTAKVIQIA